MSWQQTYLDALRLLPLVDLYREQDLHAERAERWGRIPGRQQQVAIANERADIVQSVIDEVYMSRRQ